MTKLLAGIVLFGLAILTYWLAYSKRHVFEPVLKIPGGGAAIALAAITSLTYGAVLIVAALLAYS